MCLAVESTMGIDRRSLICTAKSTFGSRLGASIALTSMALTFVVACGDDTDETSGAGGNGGTTTSPTSTGGTGGMGAGGTGAAGGMGGVGGVEDCSDMTAQCATQCNALAALSDTLMCANSGIVAADCTATCEQVLTTSTSCTCEYLAYTQCVVDSGANGVECDIDGETVFNTAVCSSEGMAYGDCLN